MWIEWNIKFDFTYGFHAVFILLQREDNGRPIKQTIFDVALSSTRDDRLEKIWLKKSSQKKRLLQEPHMERYKIQSKSFLMHYDYKLSRNDLKELNKLRRAPSWSIHTSLQIKISKPKEKKKFVSLKLTTQQLLIVFLYNFDYCKCFFVLPFNISLSGSQWNNQILAAQIDSTCSWTEWDLRTKN